jgi:acyl-CoA reductase-like NAD-dependent aldehyde dehydrogenase/ABC-type branched-subunit amino acid transport system ATPase component
MWRFGNVIWRTGLGAREGGSPADFGVSEGRGMLEVAQLSVSYGKHRAIDGVALSVGRGEIVVMLGANGAGKSSCLKALGGVVPRLPGARITLGGNDLTALAPHKLVEAGLALVPEDRGIFADLSVHDNLKLGAFTARARARADENLARVVALFPRLAERMGQLPSTMSGGERQMVAIGRALMSAPDILLLDEPSLGLSPLVCSELFQALGRIGELGVGVLLVEQNARQALAIASRGYLLENGRIVGEGAAAQLRDDPAVRRAYLGGARDAGNGRTQSAAGALLPGSDRIEVRGFERSAGNGRSPVAANGASARTPEPPCARDRDSEGARRVRVEPSTSQPSADAANERRPGSETMIAVDLMINNADVKAAGNATFDRLNPMTGDVAARAAASSADDAVRAADAAAAAFPAWSEMAPAARRALLNKAADLIEAAGAKFAPVMAAETGSTAMWAGFNCMLAGGMVREAAAMTTQIAGEVIPSNVPGSLAMGYRQPVGVVAGIAPWNAPVILGVRAIAMPLACGNTVILKASEMCPGTHRLIGTLFRDAGFPPGVVNVVTNAPKDAGEVVEALIAHPAVRRVNFTGSSRVGKIIARKCAEHLKPVLLELGGKSPLVVLEDADLDEAVNAAAFGAFANQGQICMSTERIVVDEKVADAFVERFAAKAKSLSVGDPREGKAVLGSVVDRSAAERVTALVLDAVAKGAKLAAGGTIDGTLIGAHVLDHVRPGMRIYDEESFGPVTTVVRARGDDEAVRIANDTPYGLSSAVFSRDVTRAFAVARRLETGICHINGPTVHDEAQMPFGGVKDSGYGRFGGKAAINEFTELRWITIQSGHRHYPF